MRDCHSLCVCVCVCDCMGVHTVAAGRVLICASDDRTCAQLREYVQRGAEALLTRLYHRTVGKGEAVSTSELGRQSKRWGAREPSKNSKGKRPRAKQGKAGGKGPKAALSRAQMVGREGEEDAMHSGGEEEEGIEYDDEEQEEEEELDLNLSSDSYYGILKEPLTVIHPLRGCSDPYGLTRVLHEVEPTYVVLYDAELSFVRQLEIYKASRPGKPLRYVHRSRLV